MSINLDAMTREERQELVKIWNERPGNVMPLHMFLQMSEDELERWAND